MLSLERSLPFVKIVLIALYVSSVSYSESHRNSYVPKIWNPKHWTSSGEARLHIEHFDSRLEVVFQGPGILATSLPGLNENGIAFITFKLQACIDQSIEDGTIIEIGGAKIGFRIYDTSLNYVEDNGMRKAEIVVFDELADEGMKWISTNLLINILDTDPNMMGGAPLLTIRIDYNSPVPVWDFYVGEHMKLGGIGLAEKSVASKLSVKIGRDAKTVLTGFEVNRQNPLFEDRNRNGIDDVFERLTVGALLRWPGERILPIDGGYSLLDRYLALRPFQLRKDDA